LSVSHVKSKWSANFQFKRSTVKVTDLKKTNQNDEYLALSLLRPPVVCVLFWKKNCLRTVRSEHHFGNDWWFIPALPWRKSSQETQKLATQINSLTGRVHSSRLATIYKAFDFTKRLLNKRGSFDGMQRDGRCCHVTTGRGHVTHDCNQSSDVGESKTH